MNVTKTKRVLRPSRQFRCWLGVALAFGFIAALVSACGSSGSGTHSSPGTRSTPTTPSSVFGLEQTGPGLTVPTTGSGRRVKGGTVTFAEAAGEPPNYISPMYSPEYCGTNNIELLDTMLYRPLYWYGNNNDPTVDYDDSIGQKPIVSNGGKTFTIHLNHYMWSDGEQVTARDLVFWMNVLDADPAKEWCSANPGHFPYNVTSYKAVNPTTFQITFNRSYNPIWVEYNEFNQLTPMPMAWDRTSLSAKAPTANEANLPDTTKAGAAAVYKLLNTQSTKLSDWASSPLWSIVDGPWRVQSTTSNGGVTFVPNTKYSGPTKPSISKFVEVPFTSESAMVDQIKSQGPKGLTVAYIPAQFQPLTTQFRNQGYNVNMGSTYSISYFSLNLHNPTMGPIFRQLYFRQAFQHLVDQNGWIQHFLHGAAVPTYGPVPSAPPDSILKGVGTTNPYPFSVSDAAALLKANGWKVVPGGQTTCEKPGTAKGDCGTGVKEGQAITFNLDYVDGVSAVQEEMQDLQSQAARVGIKIQLTTHPFNDVYSAAVQCTPNEPSCRWTAENWGEGWIFYLPTGEILFHTGAVSNYSNYSSPAMNKLIQKTIAGPAADEIANMKAFENYAAKELPVVYVPTQVGTFNPGAGTLIDNKIGGYTSNALGFLLPEDWYLTK